MPRPRAWGDIIVDSSISAGTPLNFNLLANLSATDTVTVVRLVGRLWFSPLVSETGDGIMNVDMGIGVSAEEAFSAAVLPDVDDPTEQPARGWLWVDRAVCLNNNTAGLERSTIAEIRFDIRSARKVDRGRLYLQIKPTLSAGSAFAVNTSGRVRALCLT